MCAGFHITTLRLHFRVNVGSLARMLLWPKTSTEVGTIAPQRYYKSEPVYRDKNDANFTAKMNPVTDASVTCEVYTYTKTSGESREASATKSGIYCEMKPAALAEGTPPFT